MLADWAASPRLPRQALAAKWGFSWDRITEIVDGQPAGLNAAEKAEDDQRRGIVADVRGGMALADVAAKHGVTLGRARGLLQRQEAIDAGRLVRRKDPLGYARSMWVYAHEREAIDA